MSARAGWDDRSRAKKGPAADEEYIAGVHADVLLLRVLAAALRRHVTNRSLQNLEQRLLHAFSGNVARDGHVLRFARDLVNFVNIDDAPLPPLYVVFGILNHPH